MENVLMINDHCSLFSILHFPLIIYTTRDVSLACICIKVFIRQKFQDERITLITNYDIDQYKGRFIIFHYYAIFLFRVTSILVTSSISTYYKNYSEFTSKMTSERCSIYCKNSMEENG